MKIFTKTLEYYLKEDEIKNITNDIKKVVKESGIKNGIVNIFSVGSTSGITTIEYDPNLLQDFINMMEKIAPKNFDYLHHRTWGDDNGSSHLRSSLIGTFLTLPVINGDIPLGTWQQVVLINFDTSNRKRKIIVQVIGLH